MAFIDGNKITLINKNTDVSWNEMKLAGIICRVSEILDDKSFTKTYATDLLSIVPVDMSGNKLRLEANTGTHKNIDTGEIYNGTIKNGVFVYGPKVDDFHMVNKDTIWAIVARATQEVDVQLQDAIHRILALEQTVINQREAIDELRDIQKSMNLHKHKYM